jgi:hypothetical protein
MQIYNRAVCKIKVEAETNCLIGTLQSQGPFIVNSFGDNRLSPGYFPRIPTVFKYFPCRVTLIILYAALIFTLTCFIFAIIYKDPHGIPK